MVTVTDKDKTEDETEYVYFEDLPTWINPEDNIPVFVAAWDCDETMRLIEERKHKVYYLVAQKKTTWEEKNKYNTTVTRTGVKTVTYKVVNNALGRSIAEADSKLGMWQPTPGLTLALPRIPMELMDKIDSLFRHVYDELKTEAVVILTFDKTIGGPEGWGFVVPDQWNTAASCDYDPPTVRERMPKDAFIAGSVHSHPAMSAYASHTDEGDQLGFDGIHVTIGWSSATNNETEYYIEAQMQEVSYTLKPSSVFLNAPKDGLDEESLKGYMEHVSKGTVTTGKAGTGTLYTGGTTTTSSRGGVSTSKSGGSRIPSGVKVTLPKDAPNPTTELIIGVIDWKTEDNCPFCESILTSIDEHHRRCMQCMLLLMDKSENLESLIAHRKKNSKALTEFESNREAHVYLGGEFHKFDIPEKF